MTSRQVITKRHLWKEEFHTWDIITYYTGGQRAPVFWEWSVRQKLRETMSGTETKVCLPPCYPPPSNTLTNPPTQWNCRIYKAFRECKLKMSVIINFCSSKLWIFMAWPRCSLMDIKYEAHILVGPTKIKRNLFMYLEQPIIKVITINSKLVCYMFSNNSCQ